MSLTPINLNKARKAKAKADAETKAAENRIRFGRTKAEKQTAAESTARSARDLDGHKRDR